MGNCISQKDANNNIKVTKKKKDFNLNSINSLGNTKKKKQNFGNTFFKDDSKNI